MRTHEGSPGRSTPEEQCSPGGGDSGTQEDERQEEGTPGEDERQEEGTPGEGTQAETELEAELEADSTQAARVKIRVGVWGRVRGN